MNESKEKEGIKLECPHCGWVWIYTGRMVNATCPSCGRKVKARDIDNEG